VQNTLKDVASDKTPGLSKALAIVDVSGSMVGRPLDVALSLSLLLSLAAKPPFQRRVMTFSSTPVWHTVTGESLAEQIQSMMTMAWGGMTDLHAALKLIVDMAVKYKVAQNQLPETLFIFSDMQFDDANPGGGTMIRQAKKLFENNGYQLPTIIFWNLRGDKGEEDAKDGNVPVTVDSDTGVFLVSGFSQAQFKVFASGSRMASPLDAVKASVASYTPEIHPSDKNT